LPALEVGPVFDCHRVVDVEKSRIRAENADVCNRLRGMNELRGTQLKAERPRLNVGSVAVPLIVSQVLAVDCSAFKSMGSSIICPRISKRHLRFV